MQRSAVGSALLLLLGLTFVATTRAAGPYKSVQINDVPHVKQAPDFCGEACVEMWTRHRKHPITQEQVFNASPVDPADGRGCYTADLLRALAQLGFLPGQTWYKFATKEAASELDENFRLLHRDLLAGVPSIVCMHYDEKPNATEHFRLVLGYDAAKDEVLYHEPAVDKGAYRRIARTMFLKLWPLTPKADEQVVIRLRLESKKLRKIPATEGFTNADYAQHVMELKKRLPEGFAFVIEKPFVVIGDQAAVQVKLHAVRTVRWAVTKLKADFFAKDPADILDVWLFKDAESYQKNVKGIFNEVPTTPYGYYSELDKALIMNINTGGGTLVHEIVHPFMANNFPKCPAWFNEGLGSLYEQASERDGHIIGLTNWRLAGLQKAIKAGKVPTFETLCQTTTQQFYSQDPGTHYAQARYLCYYLQEHGLLIKFFREFTANVKDDPGGYKTLQKVLGEKDMSEFQKRWEKWVAQLTFP